MYQDIIKLKITFHVSSTKTTFQLCTMLPAFCGPQSLGIGKLVLGTSGLESHGQKQNECSAIFTNDR